MADTTDTSATPAKAKTGTRKTTAKATAPRNTATKSTPRRAASGGNGSAPKSSNRGQARTRFNAAIDEARAGVAALRADAVEKSAAYRKTATESTSDWVEEAKAMGAQARKRAADLANDGKARASDGLAQLGKTVSDTATTIDDKLGKQYGDYARTAARSMQEAAAKLDSKELGELGEDAREFIRNSPGAAIGIAAVAGFFLARMFRGGGDDA